MTLFSLSPKDKMILACEECNSRISIADSLAFGGKCRSCRDEKIKEIKRRLRTGYV